MSDIIDAIKDAVNPSRREEATAPTYDPHKRGPYPDQAPPPASGEPGDDARSKREAKAQAEAVEQAAAADDVTTGTTTGTTDTAAAADPSPKAASGTGFDAPEGTYGPHSSRLANALDPRVDSNRDGHPHHGRSELGGAATKPAHVGTSAGGISMV
ncbi:hypothetical protein B0T24DRAFT_108398 [Lasiosphaeria ovina]|uniref:Uncharacterized protein n=1 Tax=Lasiosphaeria ovina TaxID=92902 RepID=A0AAE0JTX6_9PEZI|nr:hypothetical protein B0T24DRAFT_108398 [Lasiosphaeria ovina]